MTAFCYQFISGYADVFKSATICQGYWQKFTATFLWTTVYILWSYKTTSLAKRHSWLISAKICIFGPKGAIQIRYYYYYYCQSEGKDRVILF